MADQAPTRRCIGSARFGIEPHDAPTEDFPRQPSQKDGIGRMCRTHWNEYTRGLARESKARKAAAEGAAATVKVSKEAAAVELTPAPRQRRKPSLTVVGKAPEDAG